MPVQPENKVYDGELVVGWTRVEREHEAPLKVISLSLCKDCVCCVCGSTLSRGTPGGQPAILDCTHLGSLHFGHCGRWFSVRQQDLHSEFNIFLKRRGD